MQAETIAQITTRFDECDNHMYSGGPPSMVNTDASSVMSQQNQVMQVVINTLKAAAIAAATAASMTSPSGPNQTRPNNTHKKSDNDMEASSTQPFSQRSVRRYTHDNYCHSCGYDIFKNHNSSNCRWKILPGHVDTATITKH